MVTTGPAKNFSERTFSPVSLSSGCKAAADRKISPNKTDSGALGIFDSSVIRWFATLTGATTLHIKQRGMLKLSHVVLGAPPGDV
mmetsp:Transcript_12001/g.16586  ORF Transcript_12001/g.16586 Transcript_12001/m.16586 type:complete len:85 (-) Transcript_12001:498-752(-)